MKYFILLFLSLSCAGPEKYPCAKYEDEVLRKALVETNSDETMYRFVSDEKEAVKFLKAMTSEFYRYDDINLLNKKVAEACRPEELNKIFEHDLNDPCHLIINEFPFFQAFFWSARHEKWSKETIELGVTKARSLIRFYISKPSSKIEVSMSALLLRSMAENAFISKDILKELQPILIENDKYMEESRKNSLAQLKIAVTCENQTIGEEFRKTEIIREKLKTLLAKYSI